MLSVATLDAERNAKICGARFPSPLLMQSVMQRFVVRPFRHKSGLVCIAPLELGLVTVLDSYTPLRTDVYVTFHVTHLSRYEKF